jgi:hypothetical protein
MRRVIRIRWFEGGAIEVPFSGEAGITVGVADAHAQRNPVVDRHPKISTLQRIGISIVHALAVGIELLCESVVIKSTVRTCQGRVAIRG